MFDRLQFLNNSYNPIEVIIEMAVIWACIYFIFRFLKGTRGAGAVKGLIVLLVVMTLSIRVLGQVTDAFQQLNFIYDSLIGIMAIVLIVVFQPELRQAMIRLGHARLFRTSRGDLSEMVYSVSDAVTFLCKNRIGALIAIERSVKLGGLVEGGQELDAKLSARLLEAIFWPNSPLHDLGVVIRGDRVVAAGVQFPLAEEGMLPPNYGSRHRAGLGVTLETDCLVVIVSEENGTVSIAERGKLEPSITREDFAKEFARRLETPAPPPPPTPKKSEKEAEAEEEPDETADEVSPKTTPADAEATVSAGEDDKEAA